VAAIAAKVAIPIVGLGGITQFTLAALAGTPIAGVAIMGPAMTVADPDDWFAGMLGVWRQRPD
jgi:thiamine monophosphate synthase